MKTHHKLALLVSVSLLSLSPQVALAEDAKCTADEIAAGLEKCSSDQAVVNGDTVVLPTITVLGNRAPVDVMKFPGSVSVVDMTDEGSHSTTIQALSQVPGFETGGGMGRESGQQYSIRGFGYQSEERVVVRMGGVKRSTGLFSNHVSSFRTDSSILKRVEVIKSGGTYLHGSGAIGGVVISTFKDAHNYLKDGQQIGLTLESRYESNNMISGITSLALNPEELPFDLLVHGRIANAGDITMADGGTATTKKAENDSTTYNSFAKLGVDITEDQRLTLTAQSYWHDLTTAWQTVYHSAISDDTPVHGSLRQEDFIAEYTWDDSDNDLIDMRARLYYANASYDRGYTSKADPTLTMSYLNEDSRWGASFRNIAKFQTGMFKHRLTVGGDYDYVAQDSDMVYKGNPRPISFHPNESSDLGIYFQNEISMFDDRFTVNFGGRFDRYKRQVEGDKVYSDSHFSPGAGVSWEVFDGITLLAGYEETFRGPEVDEYAVVGELNPHYWYIPNPNLKPEVGKNLDIGFSVSKDALFHESDSLRFKALYYTGSVENMINLSALGTTPIPGYGPLNPAYSWQQYAQYNNVQDAKKYGVEIKADYWIDTWHFGGTFEYMNMYDKLTKKKVPSASAPKARITAEYTHAPWDLTIGAEVNHWFKPAQNPKTLTSRGTTYTRVNQAFTQAHLKASWKPKNTGFEALDNKLQVTAGVNNVFDQKYINARNVNSTSRVGRGRNFFVHVKKSF